MADPYNLQIELQTVKAKALSLRSLRGLEEVSQLFEYELLAVSDDATLSADDLLGTSAAVALGVGNSDKRWFHGLITAFGIEGRDGRQYSYRLTLRPFLWLATLNTDIRIFQAQSAVDIIKKVLAPYKGHVSYQLSGSAAARDYCVQYRETDFSFVSRLMEEEGIFYFFRHAKDKHELVLADAASVHETVPGLATLDYLQEGNALSRQRAIQSWQMRHEIQTGKFTLKDYNFETPASDLTSSTAAASRKHGEALYEAYDYPGRYKAKGEGDSLAKLRLEAHEGQFARFVGKADTPGLVVGTRFKLKGHPRGDQNAEYITLATELAIKQAPFASGGGANEWTLQCQFTVQPYGEPLRPLLRTPKPVVAGPQTAVVVGDGDAGDILTDAYGRVKLQFHWDRLGKKKADSSCWVRVASGSAGNGWGMISLPRLGQEVVVDFLDGDPDRPLVTGSVYNAEQKTPYELPANATVSTIKSRSKQGEADKFNELRFEDKAGSEYLLLHAQKDRIEFVEETLTSEIGKQEHRTVKDARKEKIEGEYHLDVAKDAKQKFGAKLHLHSAQNMLLKSDGLYSLKAAQDITAQAGTALSLKSGTDMHVKVGTNLGAEAGVNVHLKAGMSLVLEAGMQLTIKAGPSSVVLGPDGVSITGPIVKINSGGSPGSGNGASPVAPTDPDAPDAPDAPKDPLSHR